MKTSNRTAKITLTKLLLGACLIPLVACNKEPQRVFSPELALMPDASFVLSADMTSMQEAPIYKKLSAIMEENQAMLAKIRPEADAYNKLGDELESITGLTNKDVSRLLLAGSLANVDLSKDEIPNAENMDLAMTVSLKKALPLEKLKEALLKISSETEQKMTLTSSDYSGATILISKKEGTSSPEQLSELVTSVLGNDQLVLVGTQKSVKGAIDRSVAGQCATVQPELETLRTQAGDSQLYFLFSLPTVLQEKLKEKAAGSASTPQGNLMQACQSLKNLTLAVKFDDKLHISIAGMLGSEQDASQLRSLLDNMVIGMAKMGLSIMLGGKPLPMLDTLKAETQPGAIVKFSLALGEQDLDTLREAGQKAAGH